MAITAEQKADAGQRFLDHIKDRVATREKAQKEAREHESEGADLLKLVQAWWDDYILPGKPISATFDTERITADDYQTKKVPVVKIHSSIAAMQVEQSQITGAKALQERNTKADRLALDLCQEIKFLREQLDEVARFQAHVARLWAPGSKTNVLSETRLKELIEDFLMAKRPAVCAI